MASSVIAEAWRAICPASSRSGLTRALGAALQAALGLLQLLQRALCL